MSGTSSQFDPPKKLEEFIEAADPQDFSQVPQELKPLMMRLAGKVALRITEEYSGPLPPPEQLAKYNQIVPGSAERIFALAERQSVHRMELEKLVVSRQLQESSVGQNRAFILALVFGGLAGAVTMMGHDTVGAILGGGTVLGLVSTFILGKRDQDKNSGENDPGQVAPVEEKK